MQRFRDSAPHAEQRRTVEKTRRSFMGKKGLIAGIVVASAGAILWLNKYAPFWRVNLCSMSGSGSVACSGDPDPNLRSKLGEFYLILNRTNSNVLKLVTDDYFILSSGIPDTPLGFVLGKYDPEREINVVIKWRGEVGIYRLRSPLPPPVAFERLKDKFARRQSHTSELVFLDS